MDKRVELGFLERAEFPEELTSPHFPSKVGGKPSWLDPCHLPSPEEIACSVCGAPRTFLLQIYAPLPSTPSACHRTFFLFMCSNPSCHLRNDARGFRIFRCQLPKRNSFYSNSSTDEEESNGSMDESTSDIQDLCHVNGELSSAQEGSGLEEGDSHSNGEDLSQSDVTPSSCDIAHPPDNESVSSCAGIDESMSSLSLTGQHKHIEPPPLCAVCGCAGPKKCSRCKKMHYCSKHHQMHDWKNGHKLFCSDLLSGKCGLNDLTYDPSYGVCLPEFVVVTEEEPAMVMEGQGEEKGEEERMREYHKYIQFGKYRDHSSKGGKQVKKVMEKAESGTTSDKVFKTFRRRVALEPEQVIRYQRGGHPLLVSQDNAPQTTDIPSCPCGADRQFEFQVMPQLLYYLKLDTVAEASVDWGTLLIYSCAASCDAHTADTCRYITDIVWKQDFSTVTK